MPDSTSQTIDLTLVIANENKHYLLTTGEGTTFTLTIDAPPSDSWWLDALHINRAVEAQLGLRATVLRCLNMGHNPDTSWRTATFLIEARDPLWTPVDPLSWEPIELHSTNKILVADLSSSPPPWTHVGWFDSASSWLRSQLQALCAEPTGEVEQVRAWFLSCILRATTSEGDYYLKAVPPLFKHEPSLTIDLSEHHAGFVPDVVAVDTVNRWTLMRSVPGVKLIQHPDKSQYLPRWEAILRRYAQVQLDYATRTDDLLSMGCFDFRLETLYPEIESLFARLPDLLAPPSNISPAQRKQLTLSLRHISTLCDTLTSSGLPPTIHHGDFHSGNILCDQTCVILDWSGFVGISHPFLFLSVVSEEHSDPAILAQLIDTYLSAWSAYAPLTTLREYARTGIILGWLAGALGHSRQITIADGPWDRKQEQDNLEYCLEMFLHLLAVG